MPEFNFIPPGPHHFKNLNVHGGVTVDGVSLTLEYSSQAMTHIAVGQHGALLGSPDSWVGWVVTAEPVAKAYVHELAEKMGRDLLGRLNTVDLGTAALENVRALFFKSDAAERAAPAHSREASYNSGQRSAAAAILQVLCVLLDRLEPGLAEKAHAPQVARNKAQAELDALNPKPWSQHVAEMVGAIDRGIGDKADVSVVVVGSGGPATPS